MEEFAGLADIRDIGEAGLPAAFEDGADSQRPKAGDTEEGLAVGAIDIDGEVFGVKVCPRLFGVFVQGEAVLLVEGDFVVAEAVFTHEEVHLVKSVFAGEAVGGAFAQLAGQVGRAEAALIGAEVDAVHAEAVVETFHILDDAAVGFASGADDELGCLVDVAAEGVGFLYEPADLLDGGDDVAEEVLLVGDFGEELGAGGFDIKRDGRGQADGFFNGYGRSARDNLEVDVAAELIAGAEDACDSVDAFHRGVGCADDPGADEDAEDFALCVVVPEEADGFFGFEGAAADVPVAAQGAVFAVVAADVGQEDFEDAGFAAVGEGDRVDPFAFGRAAAVFVFDGTAGAGQVVLGVGTEDGQLINGIRLSDDRGHTGIIPPCRN